MGMYVLHVLTGSEDRIADRLRTEGYTALVPAELRLERRQGRARPRRRLLMPGYVCVEAVMDASTYYAVTGIPGVIRMLNYDEPLDAQDAGMIRQCGDSRRPVLTKHANGRYTIDSGSWQRYAGRLARVSERAQRAVFRVDGANELLTITCTIQKG